MPRRANLTTGSDILRRKRSRILLNNAVLNTANDNIDILDDSFKCALNLIPRNFQPFYCGPLNMRCSFCTARHFKSEVTLGDTQSFTLCCHNSKVILPPYTQNTFFENLWKGLSSTDNSVKHRSKNYFQNIRSYNASFAMVSSEAKISDTV